MALHNRSRFFFPYYNTKDERVQLCSFYLKGEASQWYDWFVIYVHNNSAWEVFKE